MPPKSTVFPNLDPDKGPRLAEFLADASALMDQYSQDEFIQRLA